MSALAEHADSGGLAFRLGRLQRLLLFWAPLILFVVITLFPFYWMLLASLKTSEELTSVRYFPFFFNPRESAALQVGPLSLTLPLVWTIEPTLEHYRYLFERTLFLEWLKNTLIVSVASTAISLTFSVLAGYALARLRFRAAGLLGILIFVSYLVPQTLLFIPLFDVIVSLGIANTYWALILTYPTFLIPFCSWLLMGYFRSIPKELEESALIDGSSRIGAIWRVVLPLALPGLLSAGIFAFTLSWNEYIYSLVFITTSTMKTVPVGVTSELIRGDAYFWGSLMAGALLASVPVSLAYSFLVDYYVAGLTAGAVKG